MRIAPLAIWAHRQSPQEIAAHCTADASLSHPNPACAESSAAYCIALAHLIRRPGDAEGALEAACAWAQQYAGGPLARQLACLPACIPGTKAAATAQVREAAVFLFWGQQILPWIGCGVPLAGAQVRQWLLEGSLQPIQEVQSLEHLGFARHAFVMAFSALQRRTPFVEAITQVLLW